MAANPFRIEQAPAAGALPEHHFELYRLAVEMADRVSARRALANSFFLSVNTALLVLVGGGSFRWYVAAAGIAVAVAWWTLLRSYRELNRVKFQVILALEEPLPARVFGDEKIPQNRELGRIERAVPWVFAALYAAELVRQAVA